MTEPVLVAGAMPPPQEVLLRASRTGTFLGVSVSAAECAALLESVEFRATVRGDELLVTVPSFRTDVVREIDLIEEVARLYGYDRIPDTLRGVRVGTVPDDPLLAVEGRLRELLVGLGFLELRPMPFVAQAAPGAVRVLNPVAQSEAYLRTTLLDTLARRAEYNLAHAGEPHLRLFEIGTAFSAATGQSAGQGGRPMEEVRVAALAMGARRPAHFTEPNPPSWDEWDAKGLGGAIAAAAFPGQAVELIPAGDAGPGEEHTPLWAVQIGGVASGRVVRLALDRPALAADAYGIEVTLERVVTGDVAPPGHHAHAAGVERGAARGRSTAARPSPRYAPDPGVPRVVGRRDPPCTRYDRGRYGRGRPACHPGPAPRAVPAGERVPGGDGPGRPPESHVAVDVPRSTAHSCRETS